MELYIYTPYIYQVFVVSERYNLVIHIITSILLICREVNGVEIQRPNAASVGNIPAFADVAVEAHVELH